MKSEIGPQSVEKHSVDHRGRGTPDREDQQVAADSTPGMGGKRCWNPKRRPVIEYTDSATQHSTQEKLQVRHEKPLEDPNH